MDISPAPGGAAQLQGQVVQGGGQLRSVRGVGQLANLAMLPSASCLT